MSRYKDAIEWLSATACVVVVMWAVRIFRAWVAVQDNPAAAMAVEDLSRMIHALHVTFWIGLALTLFSWGRARLGSRR